MLLLPCFECWEGPDTHTHTHTLSLSLSGWASERHFDPWTLFLSPLLTRGRLMSSFQQQVEFYFLLSLTNSFAAEGYFWILLIIHFSKKSFYLVTSSSLFCVNRLDLEDAVGDLLVDFCSLRVSFTPEKSQFSFQL